MKQSKLEVIRQKKKLETMDAPVIVMVNAEFKTWDFYKSDMWKNKRIQMLKKRGFKCELCGDRNNLHVHHKKYKKFKPLTHLQVLCKICHAKQHPINGRFILNT